MNHRYLFLLFIALVLAALSLQSCAPRHIDPPIITVKDVGEQIDSANQVAAALGDGYLVKLTKGVSMQPFIHEGDALVINTNADTYDTLEVGQIIVYKADWAKGQLVCHRLAAKDGSGWILSGDNNKTYENQWRVTKATYVGVVVKIYRVEGR